MTPLGKAMEERISIKNNSHLINIFQPMNDINKVSNPTLVKQRWNAYKDSNAGGLFIANDGKHKYYITTPSNKKVSFGAIAYEDYTKTKDEKKRKAYLARAKAIKGDWAKDKYSPNNLAIHLLW